MNHDAFQRLIREVVRASGAWGRVKQDLGRELESHIWEAVQELESANVAPEEIPQRIIERFGSPSIVGQQLSRVHGVARSIVYALAIFSFVYLFVFLLLPSGDPFRRYQSYIEERYADFGWYRRAVEIAGEYGECRYEVDGVGVRGIPFGYVLTDCSSLWLIVKFLPPIQIAGPRVDIFDVVHVMKMEGGLRRFEVVVNDDPLEEQAKNLLTSYFQALAIGAGHAPTEDLLAGNDEPPEFGEVADRRISFYEAASYLYGEGEVLASRYPNMISHEEPFLKDVLGKQMLRIHEVNLLHEACTQNLLCYPIQDLRVESVVFHEEYATVVLIGRFIIDDPEIASRDYVFEVTRFSSGYPNDWTDDSMQVTQGLIFRE